MRATKNEPSEKGSPGYLETMVRMRGLEPPRCHHHRLLRPARLPVPPHPHAVNSLCEATEGVSRMTTQHKSGGKPAFLTASIHG